MADSMKHGESRIHGRISHKKGGGVSGAEVVLSRSDGNNKAKSKSERLATTHTDASGCYQFNVEPAIYGVSSRAFGESDSKDDVVVEKGCATEVNLCLPFEFAIRANDYTDAQGLCPATRAVVGKPLLLTIEGISPARVRWITPVGARGAEQCDTEMELVFTRSGRAQIEAIAIDHATGAGGTESDVGGGPASSRAEARASMNLAVSEAEAQTIRGNVGVTLQRTGSEPTPDQALWVAIRDRTDAISFSRYRTFIDEMLSWGNTGNLPPAYQSRMRDVGSHLHGVGAYKVLKTATEIFLIMECGVRIDRNRGGRSGLRLLEEQSRLGEPITLDEIISRLGEYLGSPPQLPYITRIVEANFPELSRVSPARDRLLLASKIDQPCMLELIWSYWHEEGMLMQTMNAISQRFQNIRRPNDRDPLLGMEIDSLRPVNNLLWGFIQDEVHRLSVARRGYEYLHEYGLPIYGKAMSRMPNAADTRSKFLEAFHNLLHQSTRFFKEDFQTTVIADGFPLLNSLKEVHLILAQGATNQFGELPWTARAEMLISQYILSRTEIREFLQSRAPVPYKEAWMPQVDSMKALQGWSDVAVTHFRDLGVFGEQLLLSIRYGDWIDVNDENAAKNWARYWRPEIQGYVHAYRATTGVDLTNADTLDPTLPAVFLQKRTAQQRLR